MTILYAISAVRARAAAALDLAAQLGHAAIFEDEPPSGSAWNNYSGALRFAADRDGWLVVLEDDAQLVEGFAAAVPRALATAPGDLVNLYYAAGDARFVGPAACSWVKTARMVHGVAWAIRCSRARELAFFGDTHAPANFRHNDDILLGWLLDTGRWNYACIPSLVEHRQDMRSVLIHANGVGEPNTGRRAAILPAGDASEIEWTSRVWSEREARALAGRAEAVARLRRAGLRLDAIPAP